MKKLSPALTALRAQTHYPRLRAAVRVLTIAFVLSVVVELYRVLLVVPRYRHEEALAWLTMTAWAGIRIAGIVAVRESVDMIVDWFDRAIQRRADEPGDPTKTGP